MNEKSQTPPKRRYAIKSFVDRMTSADADPEEYEREREAAERRREAQAERDAHEK